MTVDKQQLPEVPELRDCKVTCHHSLQRTRRKGYVIPKLRKISFRYRHVSNVLLEILRLFFSIQSAFGLALPQI